MHNICLLIDFQFSGTHLESCFFLGQTPQFDIVHVTANILWGSQNTEKPLSGHPFVGVDWCCFVAVDGWLVVSRVGWLSCSDERYNEFSDRNGSGDTPKNCFLRCCPDTDMTCLYNKLQLSIYTSYHVMSYHVMSYHTKSSKSSE